MRKCKAGHSNQLSYADDKIIIANKKNKSTINYFLTVHCYNLVTIKAMGAVVHLFHEVEKSRSVNIFFIYRFSFTSLRRATLRESDKKYRVD